MSDNTVYDILRGISQVASMSYDGAVDQDGQPVQVGLKREEGNPLIDKRIMDGFSVSFFGDGICIKYHSEMTMKELHNMKDLEGELEAMIAKIADFLKKEYKKKMGSSLILTPKGECDAHVEYISRIRCWVTCKKHYVVRNLTTLENPNDPSKENNYSPEVDKWLRLGGLKER